MFYLRRFPGADATDFRTDREQRSGSPPPRGVRRRRRGPGPSYQRYTAQPALELLAALPPPPPPPLPDGLTGSAAAAAWPAPWPVWPERRLRVPGNAGLCDGGFPAPRGGFGGDRERKVACDTLRYPTSWKRLRLFLLHPYGHRSWNVPRCGCPQAGIGRPEPLDLGQRRPSRVCGIYAVARSFGCVAHRRRGPTSEAYLPIKDFL